MNIDQSFDELHRLLRGSRSAVNLVNVRSLFDAGEFAESIEDLKRIRDDYQNSRKSTLTGDSPSPSSDKEERQAQKRHDKTIDALQLMEGLISRIQIVAHRATANHPPQNNVAVIPVTVSNAPHSSPSVETELRWKLANSQSDKDVRQILLEQFKLEIIQSQHPFAAGDRLVIFSADAGTVVQVEDPPVIDQSLRIVNWSDGKRLVPIPIDKLIKASAKGKAFRLTQPNTLPPNNAVVTADPAEIVSETAERDKILDMGAFTQLLDAAQRSGIVPGAGIIIQVRDCEYRLGRYNKALQMMETLYTTFVGAEMQRNQRLQIEENEIASGRKKMSQRDLQAKRIRDNQNTQAVERAKVRFQRVLEGLRGLLPLESHVDV